MEKVRQVRKRDSRIVPFDESKIADAIYAAIRSVGAGDRALAVELASAVTHFLQEKFTGVLPGIEDIQDQVETVLIEMGHAQVAKAYILYRQKRATLRQTLQVRKVAGHEGEGVSYDYGVAESATGEVPASELPQVDRGFEGVSHWQKSKIVAALIREADLDSGLAEEVASHVERKVLESGSKRISTSLVRELVDNELFERGFSAKLQRQTPLGLAKYNVEQIIFGADSKEGYTFPKRPPEVRNIIANRILHQYSLQEVFTPSVADAHREGRIFIHRLSDPIRLSRLRWNLPVPGSVRSVSQAPALSPVGDLPASFLDQRDFFGKLWHLSHFFSEEIRLVALPNLLLDPALRALGTEEKIRAVLERLAQMDARPDIALEFELLPEVLPWLEALQALSQVRQRRFLVGFRLRRELLEHPDAEQVLHAVADLYERGERIEFLPREDIESWTDESARPGAAYPEQASRFSLGAPSRSPAEVRSDCRLEAGIAKITINLPRAAFRSARERGNSIEAEIGNVVDLVIKGHLERRRFVERLGANRENPLWDLLGKASGAPPVALEDATVSVGILGLNECVKFLTGNDLHQSSTSARLGAEIVKGMDRKLRREARSLGLRLCLEETRNVGPLRVLEREDRKKYSQMAEVDRGRQPQWGPAYSDGVRFHRMAPADPLRRVEELAPYLEYVETSGGIVEDFNELRSSAKELLLSLLEGRLPIVAC